MNSFISWIGGKRLLRNKILEQFPGAELNVKYSDTDPVDTIDLFSMKSHDFITLKLEKLETISFKDISDEIDKKYNQRKKHYWNP